MSSNLGESNRDVLLPVEEVDAQEPEEGQKEGRRRKNPDDGLGHEVAMDVTEEEGEEGREPRAGAPRRHRRDWKESSTN